MGVSAPSLHRESTDSLIYATRATRQFIAYLLQAPSVSWQIKLEKARSRDHYGGSRYETRSEKGGDHWRTTQEGTGSAAEFCKRHK